MFFHFSSFQCLLWIGNLRTVFFPMATYRHNIVISNATFAYSIKYSIVISNLFFSQSSSIMWRAFPPTHIPCSRIARKYHMNNKKKSVIQLLFVCLFVCMFAHVCIWRSFFPRWRIPSWICWSLSHHGKRVMIDFISFVLQSRLSVEFPTNLIDKVGTANGMKKRRKWEI